MVFWYFQNKPANFHFKQHFIFLRTQLKKKRNSLHSNLIFQIIFKQVWGFLAGVLLLGFFIPFTSLEPPWPIYFSLTGSYSGVCSRVVGLVFFPLQPLQQTKPTHDLMHSNSTTCMRTRRCLLSCTQMCRAGEGILAGGTLHLPCMDLSTGKTHFALKLQTENSTRLYELLSPSNAFCSLKARTFSKMQCGSACTF